ncbi:MAG: hypothetical protein ACREBM_00225, partial [Sphingomicrobium sp.]
GIRCEYPVRGNVKRRVEAIRTAGAKGVLFVKSGERPGDRIHFSQSKHIDEDGAKLLLKVLGSLPEPYDQLSGDDLK